MSGMSRIFQLSFYYTNKNYTILSEVGSNELQFLFIDITMKSMLQKAQLEKNSYYTIQISFNI